MNVEQWNASDNALEMLNALKTRSEKSFIEMVYKLQMFYIDCCRDKLYLLPQEDFKTGLDIAEAYINNQATQKELQTINWSTEGAVFGMDYNVTPEINEQIYKNISITLGLGIKESKEYAIRLGYFIDWTMLYATSFNGDIPEKYSEFLIPDLLRKEVIYNNAS